MASAHPVEDNPRRDQVLGRCLAVAAMLAAGALVTACVAGDVPEAPTSDDVLSEGRAVYAANCVNCHGTDGGGGQGTRLNGGLVVERYPDPDDQLAVIADGGLAMPAFGDKLTDDELDAVVRYTREVLAEP